MDYDNLKLEKGMYRQEGMNFTQVLESLDPSENYRGTALKGTDAFQRQLKRFGIRARNMSSLAATFVPFTAQTRMSGVDVDHRRIRKGAAAAVFDYVRESGGFVPLEMTKICTYSKRPHPAQNESR